MYFISKYIKCSYFIINILWMQKWEGDCSSSSLIIIHCWVSSLLIPAPSPVLYSRWGWGCKVLTKLTEATLFHPAWYFHSYNQSDIVHILGNIYPELKIFQETGHEPAGSEGAKFRLWVKSKGLSLRPGPGEASSQQQDAEADTRLYLPTGTEQVRCQTRILFLVLVNTSKRGDWIM